MNEKIYKELYKMSAYQINLIKERSKLNFDKELVYFDAVKKKFSHSVKKHLAVFIRDTLAKGVDFFFLETKIINYDVNDTEFLHLKIEDLINYMKRVIEMIEFVYLSVEKDKRKSKTQKFKVYIVLGVRSLSKSSITDVIRDIFNQFNENIKVSNIKGYRKIKKIWDFVIKENNYMFHRFVYFSKFNESLYNSLSQHELQFSDDYISCYNLGYSEGALNSDVVGVQSQKPSSNNILLCIIKEYFNKKQWALSEGQIFFKTKKSKFTWELFSTIDYLDFNIKVILEEMRSFFIGQLFNFDINEILVSSWDKVYKLILDRNSFLPCIVFDYNIIEFSDGLYFTNYNYFYSFDTSNISKLKVNCSKYFNFLYSNCIKSVPSIWLNSITHNNFFKNKNLLCKTIGESFNAVKTKEKRRIRIKNCSLNLRAMFVSCSMKCNNIKLLSNENFFAFRYLEYKIDVICVELLYTENGSGIDLIFDDTFFDGILVDNNFIIQILIFLCSGSSVKLPTFEFEIPNILLYCNNLFFEKYKNKTVDEDIVKFLN